MFHWQAGQIPLAVLSSLYLALALYLLLSERYTRSNILFILFTVCMHLWALGALAIKVVEGFAATSLMIKLIAIGVVFALPVQVMFALTFYGKALAKAKMFWAAVFVLPVIAYVLVATNELHSLAFYNIGSHGIKPAPLLIVVQYYDYLLAIFLSTLFLSEYLGAVERRIKKHSALFLMGTLIFIVSGPLGIFFGIAALDAQAFGMLPFILVHTYGIFRFRIASIGPLGLRFLFSNLRSGVLFLDQSDLVIMANESAGEFLGIDPNQMIGNDFFKFVAGMPDLFETAEITLKRFEEIKATNELLNYEFAMVAPNPMIVAMTCYPVKDRDVTLGRMIQLRDVTERRFLQKELQLYSENLEKAVDEKSEELRTAYEQLKIIDETRLMLLQNISHELRTPLVAVKGYAELMIREKTGKVNEKQKHFLEIILRNSSHLTHLIGQLLDYAMLESGSLELERSEFDLVNILRDVMVNAEPSAERQGVTLDALLPQLPLTIFADRERLRQAFSNLVNNAIKFNRRAGKVELSIKIIGSEKVQITVSDNGIGISEDHQRRIFERFYRADSSSKSLHGGAGIGLALTREIVEKHEGSLALKSEVDVGTTFYVTLPLRPKNKSA